MELKPLEEITPRPVSIPVAAMERPMSRRDKLERWATALERHAGRLRPLRGVEYLPAERLKVLRGDDSPLALAYGDPAFRIQGLASDRLGDGMAFFELSRPEAHRLLCDCYYGGGMSGKDLARRLRFSGKHPVLSRILSW